MPRTCVGSMPRPRRIAASTPVYSAAWIPAVTSTVGPETLPEIAMYGHVYFASPGSPANVKSPLARSPAVGTEIGPIALCRVRIRTPVSQKARPSERYGSLVSRFLLALIVASACAPTATIAPTPSATASATASLTQAPTPAAPSPAAGLMPLFDAHLHYSAPAWSAYPPNTVA